MPTVIHGLNNIKRAIQHSHDYEVITRRDIVEKMYPYIEDQLKEGIKLKNITRHMLGLFSNQPELNLEKLYKSNSSRDKAGVEVLQNALDHDRNCLILLRQNLREINCPNKKKQIYTIFMRNLYKT